jgi:hypothetical protein
VLVAVQHGRFTEAQALKSEQEHLRRTYPLSEDALADRAAALRRLLDKRVDEVRGPVPNPTVPTCTIYFTQLDLVNSLIWADDVTHGPFLFVSIRLPLIYIPYPTALSAPSCTLA